MVKLRRSDKVPGPRSLQQYEHDQGLEAGQIDEAYAHYFRPHSSTCFSVRTSHIEGVCRQRGSASTPLPSSHPVWQHNVGPITEMDFPCRVCLTGLSCHHQQLAHIPACSVRDLPAGVGCTPRKDGPFARIVASKNACISSSACLDTLKEK